MLLMQLFCFLLILNIACFMLYFRNCGLLRALFSCSLQGTDMCKARICRRMTASTAHPNGHVQLSFINISNGCTSAHARRTLTTNADIHETVLHVQVRAGGIGC